MQYAFIFDAVRTPRGKGREGGALCDVTPVELQKVLIEALIERNSLDPDAIGDLILGCVTQVGEQGGNIAKVAALYAALPASVPGMTINRYCTSGLDACNIAASNVMAGQNDIILAGGVESMSRVPMLSDDGSFYTDPAMIRKAHFVPMGLAADLIASLDDISRAECDAYAVRSQQRAAAAQDADVFCRGLIGVGDCLRDESVRREASVERLAGLEPFFEEIGKQGYEDTFKKAFPALTKMRYVHHAGNSPAVVDGASLVVVGSAVAATDHAMSPRARIVAMSNVSDNELLALTGGISAAKDVLHRAGMSCADIDLVEFNEAFSATTLKFLHEGGFDEDRVNVNGGAIALGHAMGATGTTLIGMLLDELERRDLATGLVAVSGAAGVGTATVIERV
jgi:acetyl-CoA C-acetyltransferase